MGEMVAAGVAEKRLYVDERVGVWSYTLLRQGHVDESSMEGYFREFGRREIGLLPILVPVNRWGLSGSLWGGRFLWIIWGNAANWWIVRPGWC